MTPSAPASRPGARRRLLTGLSLAVSLAAVAAVAVWASGQDAPELPSGAGEWGALAGAVGLYAAATALRAERWLALLRHERIDAGRADAYGLTLVGFMGNNVLPARAGDALRVVLLMPRAGCGARPVVGTMVAERLLDVAVLFALFAGLAGVVAGGASAVPRGTWIGLALLAAGGAGLLVLLWAARRRGTGRLARVAAFLAPVLAASRRLLGPWGARMLALTLVLWLVEGGVWLAAGHAAGLELDPLEALYLLGLASLFLFIPAGPGYAGTLDAAVVIGVRALGRSGGAALSYLVMLRFVLLIPITLAGLAVLVARYGGRRALGAARAQTEAAA